MQRVQSVRSVYESAGPRRLRSVRSAASLASASGVYGGTRPSGGSVMSEVRVNALPSSRQKALYVPGSPAVGGASNSARLSASKLSASSSEMVALPASVPDEGRSSGV